MKIQKRKSVILSLFVALFLSIIALFVSLGANNDKIGVVRAEALLTKYSYGAEFTVPDLLDGDNQVVKTEKILHFPNGIAYKKDTYVLDVVGEYQIEYRILDSDNKVIEVVYETFNVYDTLYSFNDKVSTAVYESDASKLTYPDLGAGLKVSLYANSLITFNQAVDMNTLNGKSPISFYVVPKNVGTRDFKRLVVRLTDAEDPNNYVTFYAHSESDATYTSMQAGAAHQPMSGRLKWGGDYPKDELQVGGTKGQLADFSFNGKHTTNGYRLYNLQLNLDTKEVVIQNKKIIDLDDPKDFEKAWNGFTNNKVYVSVGVEMVENKTGDFVITNVHGVDLTAATITNDLSPVISVDTLGYDADNLPVAEVGKAYNVFKATGDLSTNRNGVVTKVYYNYENAEQRRDVQVVDNAFTPMNVGRYTIEYTAADIYGFTSVECLNVMCVDKLPSIVMSVNTDQMNDAATVGIPVCFNTEFNAFGGSGNLVKDISIYLDGEKIQAANGTFTPEKQGKYVIYYSAKDYLGTVKLYQYEINATFSDKPIFISEPELLNYYISGSTYSIKPYSAYDYASASYVDASVSVVVGSTPITVENGKFNPTSTNVIEEITFKFEAGGSVKEVVKTIYNVGLNSSSVNILNYFATSSSITVDTHEDDGEIYPKLKTTADGSFTFINPLLAEGAQVKLDGLAEESNFESLSIVLTDSINSNETVTFTLIKGDGEGASVVINDKEYTLKKGFLGELGKTFNITYSREYINFCAEVEEKITRFDDGNEFNGFSSGFIYFTVRFNGVSSDSAIVVSRVWSQNLSVNSITEYGDMRKPVADFSKDLGRTFTLGDDVVIPMAYVFDVLDPNPTATIIVRDPDGEVVNSKDNISLNNVVPNRDYVITLSKVGVYTVTFNVKDGSGNKDSITKEVFSNQIIEPTITLDDYDVEADVGDTIDIAKATAFDAEAVELDVYVFVVDINGKLNRVENGGEFDVEKAGVYRVSYMAKDANGNISYAGYTVTVK